MNETMSDCPTTALLISYICACTVCAPGVKSERNDVKSQLALACSSESFFPSRRICTFAFFTVVFPITLTTLFVSIVFGSGDENVIGLLEIGVVVFDHIVIFASHFMASL